MTTCCCAYSGETVKGILKNPNKRSCTNFMSREETFADVHNQPSEELRSKVYIFGCVEILPFCNDSSGPRLSSTCFSLERQDAKVYCRADHVLAFLGWPASQGVVAAAISMADLDEERLNSENAPPTSAHAACTRALGYLGRGCSKSPAWTMALMQATIDGIDAGNHSCCNG